MTEAMPLQQPVHPGACDCHTHVFGPHDSLPLWEGCRSHTPPGASTGDGAGLNALTCWAGNVETLVRNPDALHGFDTGNA